MPTRQTRTVCRAQAATSEARALDFVGARRTSPLHGPQVAPRTRLPELRGLRVRSGEAT